MIADDLFLDDDIISCVLFVYVTSSLLVVVLQSLQGFPVMEIHGQVHDDGGDKYLVG